jgi:putative PIN family toxin of toxin-antitoxin system
LTRVTLDTNEYISAFNFPRGPAMRLLHNAVDRELEIFTSEAIINETLRVLREKFGWQGYDVLDIDRRLRKLCNIVAPSQTLNVITYDPPDNRILECAAESGSQFIITEDKDLLRLRTFDGIKIVKAVEFLGRGRNQ